MQRGAARHKIARPMSRSIRLPLRIGLPWLVWLALLLPLAQSAAAWHAYSHTATAAAGLPDDGSSAAHAAQCDLCLTAAAASGPALPAAAPALAPDADASHRRPDAPVSALPARRLAAYRSRAPPSSSR